MLPQQDYVGQEYFERVLCIGQDGFEAIRAATSWCTDRAQSCRTPTAEPEPEANSVALVEPSRPGRARPDVGLSAAERAMTGRRCKRLLDAGRLWWLKQLSNIDASGASAAAEPGLGMDAELVEYVDESTSLENCMLLAWPRKTD